MLSLLLSISALAPPIQEPQTVTPRVVKEAELRGRGFDAAWEFPRHRANGTSYPGVDFEEAIFRLARQPLLPAQGGQPEIWLGDLVKEMQAGGWTKDTSKRVLKRVEDKLSDQDWERVRQLLSAWDLYGKKWNPRSSGQRHGMHFGKQWKFGKNDWAEAKADREVEQIAQVVLADLAAIKTAEADYQGYWSHRKHDWERIEVDLDSALQVRDEAGGLLAASLDIDFEFDLPFPFSTAEFHLHTLNRLLDDGRPVLYLHGTGSDLHWLAGYDVYEPIRDRDGAWVGTLMVRVFGLDIDGVPDGRGDRHDNLRGQFGNLRRDAEALFRERNRGRTEPEIAPYTGILPDYAIRDGRKK